MPQFPDGGYTYFIKASDMYRFLLIILVSLNGRQVERNKTNDSLVVYFAVQLVTAFCTNSLSFDF